IACGMALFAYVVSHYVNHALGNVSYAAMEAWLRWHMAWWRNPLVVPVLYGAAVVHFSLGLWALYQRRHFRYLKAELAQLLLGLSIPLWLDNHLVGVRLQGTLYGRELYYMHSFSAYWVARPYMEWVQFGLLTVAWSHACIGLHFWLRMRRFYVKAAPFLRAAAVLLPVLAALGLVQGAREVMKLREDPQWLKANFTPPQVAYPDQRAFLDTIIFFYVPLGYAALLGVVFAARGVRAMRERRHGTVALTYPDRTVEVPKGVSVLDASLRYRIPHASVCGGRARCSTCRIRVLGDPAALPRPSAREAFVLNRVGVGADPAIRLACQLRPMHDLAFVPLMPPNIGAAGVRERQRPHLGEERYVVSLFADMRGSTELAERQLPFDTVFLVNQFLRAVAMAVLEAGGQPNQFLGDGLLALFGLRSDAATASRQAVAAAAKIAANVAEVNRHLAEHARKPIRFGIGIHGGDVIVGDVGYRDHMVFTAMGDPVNVAARLQDMTKSLDCTAVLSDEVREKAGLTVSALPVVEVEIRGRDGPMLVRKVDDPAVLAGLLGEEAIRPEGRK
ncbi:MAG TPA: adenylate/guanylate cyclase domain-containing protein, partial [Stellaceae bacterium]|nr:adenylate/guanylate cyclase domain-containing protein [Stellaceae bacterium]